MHMKMTAGGSKQIKKELKSKHALTLARDCPGDRNLALLTKARTSGE